jgi:hypothetical protein
MNARPEQFGSVEHIKDGVTAEYRLRDGDIRTREETPQKGTYPGTKWRHCRHYELHDQRFADKPDEFVDCLIPHREFFHHVRVTGGTAQMILQFFADEYPGDRVPSQVLANIVDLRLDLQSNASAIRSRDEALLRRSSAGGLSSGVLRVAAPRIARKGEAWWAQQDSNLRPAD